jgi:ferrochelatase
VRRADRGGRCLERADCCAVFGAGNDGCYRAQCHETARQLAHLLDLPAERWSVAFQSRLGRDPWIRPFTDEVLAETAKRGERRIVVVPSFVADCLETLEELGLRGAEIWRANGGEELALVPALNAIDPWADALLAIARDGSPAFAAALAAAPAEAPV